MSYEPRNRMRRQDAPEYIAENGSIYVFKPRVLRELNCRLGGKIVVFPMDAMADPTPAVPVILKKSLRAHF